MPDICGFNKRDTHCSNERKIEILALAPEDWTMQKTVEFFNVSEHAVKQARNPKKEKGILATPSNHYREGLDTETKNCVVEFYERWCQSYMSR